MPELFDAEGNSVGALGAASGDTATSSVPAALRGPLATMGAGLLSRGLGGMDSDRQAVQDAMQRLADMYAEKQNNGWLPLLAWSSAIMQPTKTGSIFESIGNAGTAAIPALTQMDAAERQRKMQVAQMGLQMAQVKAAQGKEDLTLGLQLAKAAQAKGLKTITNPKDGSIIAFDPENPAKSEVIYRPNMAAMDAREVELHRRKKAIDLEMSEDKGTEAERNARALGLEKGTPEYKDYIMKYTLKSAGEEFSAGPSVELARGLGVPVGPDVFKGLSRKSAEDLYKNNQKTALKDFDESALTIAKEQDAQKLTDRFLSLNQEIGKMGERSRYAGALGGTAMNLLSDAYREMESISEGMARKMRQPGEGAVSDFEGKAFKKMVMNPQNPFEVNQNIGNFYKQLSQRNIDREQFKQEYFEANKTLMGWQKHWMDYLNDNPLFDPNSKDVVANPNRKRYNEYFREKYHGGQKSSTTAPTPAPTGKGTKQVWNPSKGAVETVPVE